MLLYKLVSFILRHLSNAQNGALNQSAPLSRPEFLLQWSAIQTEKIGTKCILIKSAADSRATLATQFKLRESP